MYSCHLFLISYASVKSIPFLSFIEPILHEMFPWYLWFSWRDLLSFPFCCFPLFLCIDRWGRLSYLSLLFFGTLHSDAYIFPFLLCFRFSSFHSSKASSDSHFAFLHFFSMGMVLISVFCTMSQTSIHSSSGTLSIRSSPLNFFVTSVPEWSSGFPYFLQFKSEFGNKGSWSEPQSAPCFVFVDCIQLLHLWLQRI